jgi:hypothetical protein
MPIGAGSNGVEVDLVDHVVEKVADLVHVSWDPITTRRQNWDKRGHTGRACQRPPPISNHERWPPRDVVRRTV